METREMLKKANKGTLTREKINGGKIRFTSLGWDDAVVTKPNEVLEIEYLDLETSGFVEAGYGPETE